MRTRRSRPRRRACCTRSARTAPSRGCGPRGEVGGRGRRSARADRPLAASLASPARRWKLPPRLTPREAVVTARRTQLVCEAVREPVAGQLLGEPAPNRLVEALTRARSSVQALPSLLRSRARTRCRSSPRASSQHGGLRRQPRASALANPTSPDALRPSPAPRSGRLRMDGAVDDLDSRPSRRGARPQLAQSGMRYPP